MHEWSYLTKDNTWFCVWSPSFDYCIKCTMEYQVCSAKHITLVRMVGGMTQFYNNNIIHDDVMIWQCSCWGRHTPQKGFNTFLVVIFNKLSNTNSLVSGKAMTLIWLERWECDTGIDVSGNHHRVSIRWYLLKYCFDDIFGILHSMTDNYDLLNNVFI